MHNPSAGIYKHPTSTAAALSAAAASAAAAAQPAHQQQLGGLIQQPAVSAAAAAASQFIPQGTRGGVSVTLTPAPAAHSNQHAGFNMPTAAAGVVGGGVTIKPAGTTMNTNERSMQSE